MEQLIRLQRESNNIFNSIIFGIRDDNKFVFYSGMC